MSKQTYTVEKFITEHRFIRCLNTIVFTFFLSSVTAIPTDAAEVRYSSDVVTEQVVNTTVGGKNVTMSKVRQNSTMDMAAKAFGKLTDRMPNAIEMKPVADFITKGVGGVDAERVVMDFDNTSKVLNVTYRLPGDFLLSVNKPLETMDDEFVMFNVYHLRDLLVSDTASIGLLAQYIRNMQKRIAEQA